MHEMQSQSVTIKKSLLLLLTGMLIFLLVLVFFLKSNNTMVHKENRKLIIENDSIQSVNIVLMDSVKETTVTPVLSNKIMGMDKYEN